VNIARSIICEAQVHFAVFLVNKGIAQLVDLDSLTVIGGFERVVGPENSSAFVFRVVLLSSRSDGSARGCAEWRAVPEYRPWESERINPGSLFPAVHRCRLILDPLGAQGFIILSKYSL
jgi:hypothetical protein